MQVAAGSRKCYIGISISIMPSFSCRIGDSDENREGQSSPGCQLSVED